MEPIVFEHLAVRPATLEYAGSLMTKYFSAGEPEIIPLPPLWGEEESARYVVKQFRALQREGVSLSFERLVQFFPAYLRHIILEEDVPLIVTATTEVTAYMKIMCCNPERPYEVAIIIAAGAHLLRVYHELLSVRTPNARDVEWQNHRHGLKNRPSIAVPRERVNREIADLFNYYNPLLIFSDDLDVKLLLYTYQDRARQLNLPPWQWRPGHYSNILALLFKKGRINPIGATCPAMNHEKWAGSVRPALTIGARYREAFGYTCALIRVYELFKFRTSQPNTRRD
jgi:hypothetical protein